MKRFLTLMLPAILLLSASSCQKKSADSSAQLAAGKIIFHNNCVRCHGEDGKQIPDWRSEVTKMTDQQIKNQILNGGGGMPPFKDQLTPQQIDEVTAYTKHLASDNRSVLDLERVFG